ncbi:HNH endonuclease [Sphingomonas faeni]|uniref:HNH endonuclease n=1 Tax=Sphingomonas faeni TaxID=185950 RepID=UPI0033533E90
MASSFGEALLFQLLRYHRELPLLVESVDRLGVSLCGRSDDLADFYVGSTVMNIHMRLVKLAVDIREERERLDDQIALFRVRAAAQLGLSHLTYGADLDDLARLAIRCAEMSARDGVPPNMTQAAAIETAGRCYSCGLYFTDEDELGPLVRTGDHVWPASLGGDTVLSNMLPACGRCNSAKQHMAVWQMCWLQPEVYSYSKWSRASVIMANAVKMALHTRAAFDHAHVAGSTLKTAFLAIGARESVEVIDDDSSIDFFNMRVHSPKSSPTDWNISG